MRAGLALAVAILVASAALTYQSATEDLYWEGEDDAANEYLEVKDEPMGHLRRIRGLFEDWFGGSSSSSSTSTTENPETVTEDQPSVDDEVAPDIDDLDSFGSGQPDRDRNPEPREKTLRVTFVVQQPYRTEYSNRDSPQFQNFSRSLADAVNVLFETLPGTQKTSLVRIQSRISDEFTCKVTLDIVTTGYDDTDKISTILYDHIKEKRTLDKIVVSDHGYSATVIDPDFNTPVKDCDVDMLQCNDGACVSGSARCNGVSDCTDGSDEEGCPFLGWDSNGQNNGQGQENELDEGQANDNFPTLAPPVPTSWSPWKADAEQNRGDNNGLGEDNNEEDTTSIYGGGSRSEPCHDDELQCDATRCVLLSQRCDGAADCDDGADEADCLVDSAGSEYLFFLLPLAGVACAA